MFTEVFFCLVFLLLLVVIHGYGHIKEIPVNLPSTSINFTIQGISGSNDSHICPYDNFAEMCSEKITYISNSSKVNDSIISWNNIVVYLLVAKKLGGRENIVE
jgi:hypothetical protein